MRKVDEVLKEIENELPGFHSNKYAILKQYCEEIINECTDKARVGWKMGGKTKGNWQDDIYVKKDSILDVKKQL